RTFAVRSALPACLESGSATTLPCADSLTSRTPPGLKTIMRAPPTSSEKTEIWNAGGALSCWRSKRVLSAAKSAQARNASRNGSRNDDRCRFIRCIFNGMTPRRAWFISSVIPYFRLREEKPCTQFLYQFAPKLPLGGCAAGEDRVQYI